MAQIMMKAYCIGWMIAVLHSSAVAINPLEIIQSRLESLYSPEEKLTNNPTNRQNIEISSIDEPGSLENIGFRRDFDTESYIPNEESEKKHNPIFNVLPKPSSGDDVLESLFELGVSDIEDDDDDDDTLEKKKSPLSELLNEVKDFPILPVANIDKSSPHHDTAHHNKSEILQYIEMLRGGAWAQFKSVALGYANWLEDEYKIQDISGKLPIPLIKKILDLGDRVNFLHLVGKKVDSGLAHYLADSMHPLFNHFETFKQGGRDFGSGLTPWINNLIEDTAWKTMHQFVDHILNVAGRFVSKREIEDFQTELSKSSPMVGIGLDLIINGPPKESPVAAEGRSMTNRKGQYDYDDHHYAYDIAGYGGHGAYDDSYGIQSYGYSSSVHLDPYLILGGLGAAALLAFLAYRVIVTTAGGERRRRSDDLTLMELSDMPNIVYTFYDMLENADEKYSFKETTQEDDTDDLVYGLNSLWYEYEKETGCVRCLLFNFVKDHFSIGLNGADSLLAAGLANLLGAEKSGQLIDDIGSAVLEGQQIDCLHHENTCDVRIT